MPQDNDDYQAGLRMGIETAVHNMGGMALSNYSRRCNVRRKDGEHDMFLKERLVKKLIDNATKTRRPTG